MSWDDQQPPPQQPPAPPPWSQSSTPPDPPARPGWARKRIAIPAAFLLFLAGVGIGSAGGGGPESETTVNARPAPTVTVTKAAEPVEDAEPAPTVTVTKTAEPKPPAKQREGEENRGEGEEAPDGKAVFKVWGSAPAGATITYGSDGENLDGSDIPMTETLPVKGDALYYQVTAQLQGGGDIRCSVTIGGETKKGRARGDYNICSAQLNSDFLGGFS